MKAAFLAPAATAALIFTGAASAETGFDASGIGGGPDRTEGFPISGDHRVVMARTDYEPFVADDPESPMNGLAGPCFGEIDVRGEAASGDGYCLFDDPEGARAVIGWTAEGATETGFTGTWTLLGGSGRWAGGTGGGTFATTRDAEAQTLQNRVEGEITLP